MTASPNGWQGDKWGRSLAG